VSSISVVVPTYNRAELLKLTIRSILAQSRPADEVIVVDDGSTDHTPEVCAELGDRIVYIRQKNMGLSAARNTGIRAATGRWVAFCDSDDLWLPEKLETQLEALEATGAGWSLTDFRLIEAGGAPLGADESGFAKTFPFFSETGVEPLAHLGGWLQQRAIGAGSTAVQIYTGDAFGMLFEGNIALPSSAIVDRGLFEGTGLFDETFRSAEETEFFHRLAAMLPVVIVMKALVEYRTGHASITAGDAIPIIQNALTSIRRAAKLRSPLTPREQAAFRRGLRTLRARLAYALLSSLDRAGARATLMESVRDGLLSPREAAILAATLLPDTALRGIHWAKQALRGGSR
jgi:glycosyltransferase involved in cell wall biosynthesis